MPESERLARLDELARVEQWILANGGITLKYFNERATLLNDLADPKALSKTTKDKIHLTRSSLIELLNTMKSIGYDNQSLAMFHIDIIVYRMQAIWKAKK